MISCAVHKAAVSAADLVNRSSRLTSNEARCTIQKVANGRKASQA